MKNLKKGQQHMLALAVTYVLLLILFVWLSIIKSSGGDNSGVIYSIILFIAVLAMYVYTYRCFKSTNDITVALAKVTEQIRTDYSEEREFLWDKYKDQEDLFGEKNLNEQYKRFCKEQKRLALIGKDNASYGNIEDYINYDLIDDKMHKNVLSIFPGTMTGLGILFTFFGLSICLQSFNTGSAADIMAGIDPLMGGLRVAFHTSIYGLIFSLMYNFCFRRILEEDYFSVDEFLNSFKECVKPESEADVVNVLIEYQQEQARVLDAISTGMVDAFEQAISPQFVVLNETITSFANAASKTQTEGMKKMVAAFLKELNKAAGDSFVEVRKTMAETCEVQRNYVKEIKTALNDISSAMQAANTAAENMQAAVKEYDGYVVQMRGLQEKLQESFDSYTAQISDNNELVRNHQSLLTEVVEAQRASSESMASLVSETQDCLVHLQEESGKFVASAEKANNELIKNTGTWTEKLDQSIVATEQRMQQAEIDLSNTTRNNLEAITRSVDNFGQKLISQTEEQVQSIIGLKEVVSADLSSSAERLDHTVQQLSITVGDAMSKGVSEYTDELLQTITDLNKTIRGVRSTTDTVPRVISDADRTLEDAITRTEQSMNQLINALEAMLKKASARQEAVSREETAYEQRRIEMETSFTKMQEQQVELQQSMTASIKQIQKEQSNLQKSMAESVVKMQEQQKALQNAMKEFDSQQKAAVKVEKKIETGNLEQTEQQDAHIDESVVGKVQIEKEPEQSSEPDDSKTEELNEQGESSGEFSLAGLKFSDD